MSYQIKYHISKRLGDKYNETAVKKPIIPVIAIVCILLLLISVYIVGIDTVKAIIIPGNDTLTVSAFHQMQDNLKNGMSFNEAVTAFCTEIIETANIQ